MRVSSISTYQNNHYRAVYPRSRTNSPQFAGYSFKNNYFQNKLLHLNPVMHYMNVLFDKSLVASRKRNRALMPELKPITKIIDFGPVENRQTYAWDINPDDRKKYIMIFHGASQNVSNNQTMYKAIITQTDYAVLAPEYRGFGKNPPSNLSAKTFLEDTTCAIEYLKDKGIKPEDIIVLGYSFGSIPASQLVKHNPQIKKLILLSAMDSFSSGTFDIVRASKNRIPKFVNKLYHWFPFLKAPLQSSLNSIKYLRKITTPVDIIHSKTDRMVNVSVVENFKRACQNIQSINIIPFGGHRVEQGKLDALISILNKD